MNKINHAIIMAAGRGQRMMPLTNDIPKAMAIYDGSTLISQGIDNIKKIIENVHISVGYKGAILAQHVIEHNVSSVFNTEGKGNCWWVYNTLLKYLNEPIVVLTCDNVIDLDFELLSKDYFSLGQPACMLVPVKPILGLEGDYIFQTNNRVTELSRSKQSDIYCSGIQVLNPSKVNSLTESTEDFYNLWSQLIKKDNLLCSNIYPKKWFTVDTMQQLTQLNKNPKT